MPLTPYQQLQQVKDHYNSIGQHFAETRKKRMWAEILPFISKVKPKMRVLDVGCGSGRLLPEFKGTKVYYTGLDFSEVLIDKAKKRFPKRRLLVRDITTEQGWAGIGQFDAVFCLGVMHHIPDRKRQHELLRKMYEHTKPGGFVVISVWNLFGLRWLKLHFNQLKKKFDYGNMSYIWVPYSVSDGNKIVKKVMRFCKAYLPGELLRLVRQVGFRIKVFYFTKRGLTHLSIFNGENFVVMAEKE